MQKKCLENISENEYKEFILVLERLVNLPFSYRSAAYLLETIGMKIFCRVRDEIFQWRVKEVDSAAQKDFLPPQVDDKGRAWVEVEGRRKTSVATVRVSKPGKGQVRTYSSLTGFYWLWIRSRSVTRTDRISCLTSPISTPSKTGTSFYFPFR